MAKNRIDKIFEENLKNHRLQPSKNLWENIENHLDNRSQKKTKVIWLSVAASIVLLLISVTFWLIQHTQERGIDKIAVEVEDDKEIKEVESISTEEQDYNQRDEIHRQETEGSSLLSTDKHNEKRFQERKDLQDKRQKNDLKPKNKLPKKLDKPKERLKFNTVGDPIAETRMENEEEELEITVTVSLHNKPKEKAHIPTSKEPSKVGKMWQKVKKAKNGGETASEE